MQCAYHPNQSATSQCSVCKKPLCSECAIPGGQKRVTCSGCIALAAAQEAVQGVGVRQEESKEKREILAAKKKKPTYLMVLIPVSAFVALVMLVFNFYFRANMPEMMESPQPEHPVVAIFLLDQAIQDYLKDHGGKVPANLAELLGKYVSTEEMTRADLRKYSYRAISSTSYELGPKNADDEMWADLFFTEGGAE